ncbi:hypothetical protein MXZ84_04235 [Streptococcus uberis]|nr:hypothetical protein [Streptococcus uberis]MCK1201909.1 hypothetical protein [Streptococcus uberis]
MYQGDLKSEEIKEKYSNEIWDHKLLNTLNKDNMDKVLGKYTDQYLDYEDIDAIYATYILDLLEKLLYSLISFQSFREEDSHWQGNYLGYVKKYQYGNEILHYLKTGDRETLRPMIYQNLQWKISGNSRINYFIKKHPESDLAIKEKEINELISQEKFGK